jgi:hypothetical protein
MLEYETTYDLFASLEDSSIQVHVSYFFYSCPMLEYETTYDLFANLKVPNNPSMHWSDSPSWTLVELCTSSSRKPLSKPYNLPNSWHVLVMR